MSLPSNNASFQKGNFQGFKTRGLAKVESSFDPFIHSRGTRITPDSGRYFARLDGAGLLGSGIQLDANGNRRSNTYAVFKDISFDSGWGTTTGGHGAWLKSEDISLAVGESIFFDWQFILTQPYHPDPLHNAFAAVRLLPSNTSVPSAMHVLIEARAMAYMDLLGVYQSPAWRHASIPWSGTAPFRGTVQWLVSSGHCVSSTSHTSDQKIACTWPACLVIDHIRLG